MRKLIVLLVLAAFAVPALPIATPSAHAGVIQLVGKHKHKHKHHHHKKHHKQA